MRILSLSTVFPSPQSVGHGLFVRARLLHLAAQAELKVLAPLPVLDYANRRWTPPSVALRDEDLQVWRPRWMYPPGGGFLNALCLFFRLANPVSRLHHVFPFDLLDAHFGHPEGVAAALLAAMLKCPFAITLRGCELIHSRPLFRRWCLAWALRRAGRVFAVSEQLRDLAVELGADRSRVRVIPNGVDTQVFFPRDRAACRQKYGIPPACRMILSAGRLSAEKGHDLLLRAVQGLAGRGVDVRLWIAGAGRLEPALREQARDLCLEQAVHFAGQLPPESIAELLSAADVFCLASWREGWPNVVQEALSCGTPVVATRVGAVPAMIPSPEYGLVVPPGDVASLQDSLLLAVGVPWNRDIIAAWGKRRTWKQVALEVFQEMQTMMEEYAPAS